MVEKAEEKAAMRVRIYGKVQGVWYRGWTQKEAQRLGLYGWVRNRVDGTVEALLVGPQPALDEMLELCKSGPSNANVREVATEAAQGLAPNRFEVKPTV